MSSALSCVQALSLWACLYRVGELDLADGSVKSKLRAFQTIPQVENSSRQLCPSIPCWELLRV